MLAVDGDEYKEHVIDYVHMFIQIYKLDRCGYKSIFEIPRFSIKELIEDLEKLTKKERDAINKFFGITGIKHYLKILKENDIALQNLILQASEAAARLRTAERMYMYNKRFKEAIDRTALKVHDPEGKYTPLEKAKFAHLYFWFIKDYQYMPYDGPRTEQLMEPDEIESELDQFPSIDSYVAESENYFSKIPDGDIVIPQIASFIWESDVDLDELMVRFAELYEVDGIRGDHGKHPGTVDKTLCCEIRAAKERIFAHGKWNADYMRLSEFAKMPKENVAALIRSYNAYKTTYEYEPSNCTKTFEWHAFLRTQGKKVIQVPKYSDTRNFIDDVEMIFFLNMISYIERYVPQFRFHGCPFKDYEFGSKIA
jgi:hypothetical protein